MSSTSEVSECDIHNKTLSVFVFNGSGMQLVKLHGISPRTYGDIKNAVGEYMNICEKSRIIFGIFRMFDTELNFYPPQEFCRDTDLVPPEIPRLGLFRLSFDAELERNILSNDFGALVYVYWEVNFVHRMGTYIKNPELTIIECEALYATWYSVPDEETKHIVKRVLQGKLCTARMKVIPHSEQETLEILNQHQTIGFEEMKSLSGTQKDTAINAIHLYMRKMHVQNLYYWSYYYKAEGTLCGENAPLLSSCFNLNEQFSIVMTVSQTCLSFLGETRTGSFTHLFDFPWCNIRFIARKGSIFSFQVQVKEFKGSQHFVTVNVFTHLCDFIYSLSVHVFGEQVKMLFSSASSEAHTLNDLLKVLKSCVPSTKRNANDSIKSILSKSGPTNPPLISDYDLCGENGYFLNEQYISLPIDIISLYVRNVKGFPKGPGEYIDGEPIHISYKSHEQLLIKPLFFESQSIAGMISRTKLSWNQDYEFTTSEAHRLVAVEINEHIKAAAFCSKKIIIHTFWKGPFWIPATKYTTAMDIKKSVVQILKMKESSLKIFGLFVCQDDYPLDFSLKLCTDNEPLPDSLHFCFRRLSFCKKTETKIIALDCQAHKLLWSEAKYMYDQDAILPVLSEKSKRHLNTSFSSGSLKQNFTELLINSPSFWWEYYYRADSSADSFTSDVFSDKAPSRVAITNEYLYLLDKQALNPKRIPIDHVLSIRTENAELMPLISLPKTPKILVIDILVKRRYRNEQETDYSLETLTIHTVQHQFLLSLSSVAFALHREMQEKRQHYITERFNNNCLFRGPSYSVLKSHEDTHGVINSSFVGVIEMELYDYHKK